LGDGRTSRGNRPARYLTGPTSAVALRGDPGDRLDSVSFVVLVLLDLSVDFPRRVSRDLASGNFTVPVRDSCQALALLGGPLTGEANRLVRLRFSG
jgi:hypothetical protein